MMRRGKPKSRRPTKRFGWRPTLPYATRINFHRRRLLPGETTVSPQKIGDDKVDVLSRPICPAYICRTSERAKRFITIGALYAADSKEIVAIVVTGEAPDEPGAKLVTKILPMVALSTKSKRHIVCDQCPGAAKGPNLHSNQLAMPLVGVFRRTLRCHNPSVANQAASLSWTAPAVHEALPSRQTTGRRTCSTRTVRSPLTCARIKPGAPPGTLQTGRSFWLSCYRLGG